MMPVPPPADVRPLVHFTAQTNWLNDPNGCVFYAGEWHLCFQHNPHANEWGNMTWGNAVSADLLHWRELTPAIKPDAHGDIFSGSAAVDWHNSGQFATSSRPAMVAAFTYAGEFAKPVKGYTQALAFSNDLGRTWTKYDANPIVPNLTGLKDRDPKIFWYEPTKQWVMVLYLDSEPKKFAIFHSTNLKQWTKTQEMTGFFECPELFSLPVKNEGDALLWVLQEGDSNYQVGKFDGEKFEPLQEKRRLDLGPNYYAAQNFNDIPAADDRRIQIGWMRGGHYPGAPFNQQMSIPCELSLWKTEQGYVVRRRPVRELAKVLVPKLTGPGDSLPHLNAKLAGLKNTACLASLELKTEGADTLELNLLGHLFHLDRGRREMRFMDTVVNIPAGSSLAKLEILLDRTTAEFFFDDGQEGASFCLVRVPEAPVLAVAAGWEGIQKLEIQCSP